VAARNQADSLIHATEKSLKELGDKVDQAERRRIEDAISDLRESMKGDDKDAIEAKTATLSEAAGKLAERVYANRQETAGSQQQQSGGRSAESGAASSEDVVDAEFEEVDDNKK
jgi:molecular chaperone DnaK